MRKLILIIGMLLNSIIVFSQSSLEIDPLSSVKSSEIILKKGAYILTINKFDRISSFKMEKNYVTMPKLETDSTLIRKNKDTSAFSEVTQKVFSLDFNDNTVYTFTIKIDNDTISRKYIFKSISKWSWSSTFGANGIFLTNPNSYKTIKNGDNNYKIIEFKGEKRIEYVPSLMFTFLDKSKDISFGYTGGIGFDLEKISVFTGISLGIGQNIILTSGVAFHQQEKLNSTYNIGQEVDTALTTENLVTKQYRFNPFVGISFRLDNNPFK